MNFSSVYENLMLCFRTPFSEYLFQNTCFRTPVSEHIFQNPCFRTPFSEHLSYLWPSNYLVFDGYLSFKIFNKVSQTCFHDKEWKLHLYVKPKFPKNLKIKEHFRQNVIKSVEKIPPGYPRTYIKIPGFLYRRSPHFVIFGTKRVSRNSGITGKRWHPACLFTK